MVGRILRTAADSWNRFFFDERDARPIVLFRMVFGLFLLAYFVDLYPFLKLQFGPGGLIAPEILHQQCEAHEICLFARVPHTAFSFHFLYALTLLAALSLVTGILLRIGSVTLWLLCDSWLNPIPAGLNGADSLVAILTFLFMIAALAGHLKGNLRDAENRRIPLWTTRLFQIQLALIYFFSGLEKAGSPDWAYGRAMHYVFHQAGWSRMDLSYLSHFPALIGILSYGTLLFELFLFPVLVWSRRTRIPVLLTGVLFHAFIYATMRVFVFSQLMVIFYLCFLDETQMRWILSASRRLCDRILHVHYPPYSRDALK